MTDRSRAPLPQFHEAACFAKNGTRQAAITRDALLAKYPVEFRHGYLSGYTRENQLPCDAASYMIGHHTWPLERKNAWFAGWNLGNCEAPK